MDGVFCHCCTWSGWGDAAVLCQQVGQERRVWKVRPVPGFQPDKWKRIVSSVFIIVVFGHYALVCWHRLQDAFCISNTFQKREKVFCILYFLSEVKSIWQKYVKWNFQKYLSFVFNTLPESIFYNSGDGDRHVGLYASLDNWHTCLFIGWLV